MYTLCGSAGCSIRIQRQLKELWKYAEGIAREELENNEPDNFEQIDAEKVKQTIDRIDKALENKVVDKKVKQKLNYAKRKWPEVLDKYDRYEDQLGSRKSLSKTDPDATFMRMKEDPRRIENLHYNQKQDCYYCPMHGSCHKAKGNRKIEVNPRLIDYKQIIKERLNSERGKQYRSRRPIEPEAVFGNIKNNQGFRKFMLRGIEKVQIEAGLLSIAHNLAKLAN